MELLDEMPDRVAFPESLEALGKTGQSGFEMFVDLATESAALFNQRAAMAHEQLQRAPEWIPLWLA